MMLLATTVAQMGGGYGDRMGRWDDGPRWWIVVPMILFGVALLAIAIWGVVALSRSNRTAPPAAPPVPSAREILDQRFARGEIDPADYQERKRLLD